MNANLPDPNVVEPDMDDDNLLNSPPRADWSPTRAVMVGLCIILTVFGCAGVFFLPHVGVSPPAAPATKSPRRIIPVILPRSPESLRSRGGLTTLPRKRHLRLS